MGPAVTRTRFPFRGPSERPSEEPTLRDAFTTSSTVCTMASGSASRPLPTHPHARYPLPGSTNRVPRAASVARLSRTAWCSHITVFMAGAITRGARVARYRALRKSSAIPFANFPMTLAVAGATTRARIWVASAMCSMSAFIPAANCDVMTGRRVMASNVSGPTNLRAFRVSMACTR